MYIIAGLTIGANAVVFFRRPKKTDIVQLKRCNPPWYWLRRETKAADNSLLPDLS